jgi:hypothetical protein
MAARPRRLIQPPQYVRRKPRPRCGLLSRLVFQPGTAKVKLVEFASDAKTAIDVAAFERVAAAVDRQARDPQR